VKKSVVSKDEAVAKLNKYLDVFYRYTILIHRPEDALKGKSEKEEIEAVLTLSTSSKI